VKKINIFVVCVSIVSVAACGDTITSVNTGSGGTSSNDDGGENVDSSGGDDAGTIKDASVNDIIANDSSLIDSPGQSCTTGHVRCSGVAQECIASAWTSAAAACNSSCSQPAGTWVVDRLQLAPTPTNLRRNADKLLFAQTLGVPQTFPNAKLICQVQYGSAWHLADLNDLVSMSPNPVVVGCNPLVDQAAFPSITANTEVWIWDGVPSGPIPRPIYSFSFATNSETQVADASKKLPVMCIRTLP